MSQKMLIDASHDEETRVVVLESKKVEDFDFESFKKLQLSGNIYLAKVTRVEPSLQAAFLDYGGNRHGFLAFSEIHPDYYQIPLEERENSDSDTNKKSKKNTKSRTIERKKSTEAKPLSIETDQKEVIASDKIVKNQEILEIEAFEGSSEDEDLKTGKTQIVPDDSDFQIKEIENDDVRDEEINSEETAFKKQHRKFRIQEVIKVRQILLIQIVKEERGNKGAALTTYLSLAGRYCVLMPNTPRGGGISRKITNLADRKKLKEIANSLLVPEGSGLIIRTAGSNRTKLEIKRDYEYLIRQWEQVRDLTLSSIAPTTIYEEGSLIKRAIRDLYSRTIEEILVEGDRGYKEAKDYMKMLMPSHAKNVKKYEQPVPLFSKYQVEDHLAAMFNPIAQLKSGGYIVINVTEALVAVDVNSGRATKETSIEDTALKTNLEAAEELSRQIKLRDLAGLIVIDFIDMEDRKNNMAVERRMKERLKNDRARTQIGRISIFGLLEMSRQRLRPGMIEMSTQACSHCHGTGTTRSDDSLSLAIIRELEQEGIKNIYSTLKLQTPINIANYMLNEKRTRIASIETRYNLTVKIDAVNTLISPEYRIERIKSGLIPSNPTDPSKLENQRNSSNENLSDLEERNSSISKNDDETNQEDPQNKRRRRRRRKPKPKSSSSGSQAESNIMSRETEKEKSLNKDSQVTVLDKMPQELSEDVSKDIEKGKRVKRPGRRRATSKILTNSNSDTTALDMPSSSNEQKKDTKPKTKSKAKIRKHPISKDRENFSNNEASTISNDKDPNQNLSTEPDEPKINESLTKRTGWWSKSKNKK